MKSSFAYKGNVDVSFFTKNKNLIRKHYYNNGTYNLFKIISMALAGNYSKDNKITFVDLRKVTSPSEDNAIVPASESILNQPSFCTVETNISKPYNTLITAQIAGENVIESSFTSNYILTINCANTNLGTGNQNILAYVGIEASDLEVLKSQSGVQMLIQWSLNFENKEVS